MIPYYSPHFSVADLLKTIFCKNAEDKLCNYFRKLTGKKYILITSSCRSALYLAYQSIEKKGIVHTSPLTCKVSLLPIIASGNQIYFNDIKKDDWTIDPSTIPASISKKSVAIQAIHFGGFPCDMRSLRKIANDYKLILIEDCAQGFGSFNNKIISGSFGDISCFSLTKNLYGIGGGIFATNNEEWFNKAQKIQMSFPREKYYKIFYRILSSALLSSNLFIIYNVLKKINYIYVSIYHHLNNNIKNQMSVELRKELIKPPRLYSKYFVVRLQKMLKLIDKRKSIANLIKIQLNKSKYIFQYSDNNISSYAKLYTVNQDYQSVNLIRLLRKDGIECMHLSHKFGELYQKKLIPQFEIDRKAYKNYSLIHDNLHSIPLNESMTAKQLLKMISILKRRGI